MDNLNLSQSHWDLAYRVALRIVRAPDQAEDIAQETMINAYMARDSFEQRSKPESWIYRIAHNTAISYLRKPFHKRYSGADVFLQLDKDAEHGETPEGSAYASQLARELSACLGSMGDKDQTAFYERFVLGTSERELGSILGVSTNAAKQRAFRARRAVRECFDHHKVAA